MSLRDVSVSFAGRPAVRDVSFDVRAGAITSLIGPSGSGKTTLLRALNRMHDNVRSASVSGTMHLGDTDIYAPSTDATLLRSRVGMVFQRPNPFPTMSIYENAVAGLRFNGIRKKSLLDEAAESALVAASLVGQRPRPHEDPCQHPLRGGAAAALHRPGPRRRAGGAPHGRADFGPRPDRHQSDRGAGG